MTKELKRIVFKNPNDDRYERYVCSECFGSGEIERCYPILKGYKSGQPIDVVEINHEYKKVPCECKKKGYPSEWWILKNVD